MSSVCPRCRALSGCWAAEVAPRDQPNKASLSGSTAGYPESVDRLLAELTRLPGIGRRSAERIAFFLLKQPTDEGLALSRAVHDVKTQVRSCKVCFNFADGDRCAICEDTRRDRSLVMVVEQPRELIALEQTGMFRGIYHCLLGRIAPLEGVAPADLSIADLLERIANPQLNPGGEAITEVVLALNPTLEGDGTALYLADKVAGIRGAKHPSGPVRVTRLARGVPSGSQIEYASKAVLADAIEGRRGV